MSILYIQLTFLQDRNMELYNSTNPSWFWGKTEHLSIYIDTLRHSSIHVVDCSGQIRYIYIYIYISPRSLTWNQDRRPLKKNRLAFNHFLRKGVASLNGPFLATILFQTRKDFSFGGSVSNLQIPPQKLCTVVCHPLITVSSLPSPTHSLNNPCFFFGFRSNLQKSLPTRWNHAPSEPPRWPFSVEL